MKQLCLLLIVILALFQTPVYAVSDDTCFDSADTILMLHMDGSDGSTTFTDEIGNSWSPTAAEIDTAQSQFGGASGLFTGSPSQINDGDLAGAAFSTNDFTIEFWIRFNTVASTGFFVQGPTASEFQTLTFDGSNIFYEVETGGVTTISISNSWSPSSATWYHFALIRTGNDFKMFVDGTQIGSTSSDTDGTPDFSGGVGLGYGRVSGGGGFVLLDGWLDEYRVVSGTAIWTTNFTPPSSAYTSCAPARRRILPVTAVQ